MKPINDTNILEINSDSLSVHRQTIPDCTNLQKSILREAQNLTQDKSGNLFGLVIRYLANRYKSFTNNVFRFQATAATAAIIITTIIISSNQLFNPAVKSIEPIDQVVWEDLWLMQDELAFAEL